MRQPAVWPGVARTLVYDNLRSAVLERAGTAIRFHPRLLELAGHYHFAPRPCTPGRGNEKGKVERQIQYLRHAFFAARTFVDIDDLNVTGSTALNGSEQVDRIEISDSTFTGKFTSTLGGGNDVLDLDTGAGDQSRFLSSVAVDFGAGTDTLDNNPLNTFASPLSGRRGPEVIV